MSGTATNELEQEDWHERSAEEALRRLASGPNGLSEAEAAARLGRFGPNQLLVGKPVSAWRIFLDQLRSVVVLLLFAAAAVALLIGDALEAGAIAAVLVINTVIGFWTELRARQAMEALQRLQVYEATVVRGSQRRRIDARALVPGDVLVLEAGASVAADARLLSETELITNEAPLTGESMPVEKAIEPVALVNSDEEVPLAERYSMVYKGTLVAAGSGTAVVVATGPATEIGQVSKLVQETESQSTPLERRLDMLGRRLVWLALGVATIVAGLGIVRGADFWLMVETGIALAIAAVPEGLPAVATITLAVGVARMARRNALVRRLPAVEALGSTTVICTDKTGTLTAGEMTLTTLAVGDDVIEVTGAGYEPTGAFRDSEGRAIEPSKLPELELALRIGVVANRADLRRVDHAWKADGDPTEAALVAAGLKAGIERQRETEQRPEVGEVPFASERQYMATFNATASGGTVAYIKGGPGALLKRSSFRRRAGAVESLSDEERTRLRELNYDLARRGLRVLALAYRDLKEGESLDETAIHDLTFVGFAGIFDPPAPGVKDTIASFRDAGVRTVMITGDQATTAEAVARDLGVLKEDEEPVTGREFKRLSESELAQRIGQAGTFSRVSPQDKLKIIEAYQSHGEIVGMLGDGVNDAAALKRADIGVAMGRRGTDVAKETADVVLQDDRFETIGAAVEEGRVIFDNIRKFIFYLFSCNVSEILVLLIAGLSGLPLPLLPLQILWLNLITDVFPALALAMEPAEPDVMERPPRDPQAAILSPDFMKLVLGYGALLTGATLGVFLFGLKVWGAEPRHAVTLAFMTLALTQIFHVFNARTPDPVLFGRRILQNRWVWGAIAVTVGLQVMTIYFAPLAQVLRTYPLRGPDWALILFGSILPLIIGQIWKLSSARPSRPEAAGSQES